MKKSIQVVEDEESDGLDGTEEVVQENKKHVSFDLDNETLEEGSTVEDSHVSPEYEEDYMYDEEHSEESMETDYLEEFLLPSSSYVDELVVYDDHERALRGLNERWEIQLESTVEQSEEILHEQSRLSEEEREIIEMRAQNEIQQAMSIAIENEEQMMVMKQEHDDTVERFKSDIEQLLHERDDLTMQLKEHEDNLQSAIELAINTVQKEMELSAKEEKKTIIETFQSQIEHERRRTTATTSYLEQQLRDTTEASKAFKDENDDQIKEIIATFEDKMKSLQQEIAHQEVIIQNMQTQELQSRQLLTQNQKHADKEYKSIIQAMKRQASQELEKANQAYEALLEIQSSQLFGEVEETHNYDSRQYNELDSSNIESEEIRIAIERERASFDKKLAEKLREKDAEHSLYIQEVILNVSEKQRAIAQQNARDETDDMDQDICHLKITKEILEQDLVESRKIVLEQQGTIEELQLKLKTLGEIQEFGSLQNYWEGASSKKLVGTMKGINNTTASNIGGPKDITTNGYNHDQAKEENANNKISELRSPSSKIHRNGNSSVELDIQRSPLNEINSYNQTARKNINKNKPKSPKVKSPKVKSPQVKSPRTKDSKDKTPEKKGPSNSFPKTNANQATETINSVTKNTDNGTIVNNIISSPPMENSFPEIENEEISSVDTEIVSNTSKPSPISASKRKKKLEKENESKLSNKQNQLFHDHKENGRKPTQRSKAHAISKLSSKVIGKHITTSALSKTVKKLHQKGENGSHENTSRGKYRVTTNTSLQNKRTRVTSSSALSPSSHNFEKKTRIMILGMPVNSEITRLVKLIGASVVDNLSDASSATHVVAGGENGIRRTSMMMIGLCSTSNIVHADWLWACFKAGKILLCTHYLLLNDRKSEKKYAFSMRQTLRNGKKRRDEGGLLRGWKVFFCKDVAGRKAPPDKDLNLIVKAAGGSILLQAQLPLSSSDDRTRVLVITSDPPLQSQIADVEASRLGHEGAGSFTTTWLFDCILHQQLTGVKRGLGR